MSDPERVLDLFCGAGGAAMGLHRAWPKAEIIGIDNRPQLHYPFEFIQMDWEEGLNALGPWADFIWASPVCKGYTVLKSIRGNGHKHPRQVEPLLLLLRRQPIPWVIENVPGAPLPDPVILCGTMFQGLRVYRHRLFECSWGKPRPPGVCNHTFAMGPSKGAYHRLDESEFITCCGHNFQAKSGKIALGIDWMTRDEMSQAVPPAYSEYIARQYSLICAADLSPDTSCPPLSCT